MLVDREHGQRTLAIRSWHQLLLGMIGILLLTGEARGLDPSRLISQYGHTVWRTRDGVVPALSSITQTTDGYLWMGQEILLRFDGEQFIRQPIPGPSQVNTVLGGRDGSLWLGTRRGLNRLKDGQMTAFSESGEEFSVNAILEDHSGAIWITRYGMPEGKGSLCAVRQNRLHCYGTSEGVPIWSGMSIAEDPAGNLWVGGEGLYHWKPGSEAIPGFGTAKHPAVNDVVVDGSGNVWAAMDESGPKFGVKYLHKGIWSEYRTASFRSSTLKGCVFFVDKMGALWIGSEDGLYRLWKGEVDHFSTKDGLSGQEVQQVMQDHEGNLWVVTDSGLDMFHDMPVSSYSKDEGINSPRTPTVLALSDGTVWAGSEDGVKWLGSQPAYVREPGSNKKFAAGPLFPGKVGAILEDHAGALWVGVKGLTVYKDAGVERVTKQNGKDLDEEIFAIVEDRSQSILALSATTLFRIQDRRVMEAIPLPTNVTSGGYLAASSDGGVWIAGPQEGLMLNRNGPIQGVPLPPGKNSTFVNGLLADAVDPLFLTTSDGLLRYDGKQWRILDESKGLPCNDLMGATKDRHGSLWLLSSCGLLKMDAPQLQQWRGHSDARPTFVVFDVLDGATIGKEQNLQPNISLAADGRVWFTDGRRIEVIDPDHLETNSVPPPVYVEHLIADDKSYTTPGTPHIPPSPRNLEIDYTALSYSVPRKIVFRYFLEGYDKAWQSPISRRQAFYTDLPPGTYRFHVKACNNAGVWNDAAVLDFIIDPAFYQTLWFRTLVACAIGGLLWTIYALRLRQATATVQGRLLTQMEERERIARELHDTLLQGFQGIALRVQGVTKRMSERDPLRGMMESVLDRADEVMLEGRQRVRNLRQRTVSEEELVARLERVGQELAEGQDAGFSLTIVGVPVILESAAHEEAYRVAAEALTNAFRHSSASQIEVKITYGPSELQISVRDNGIGIDGEVLNSGQPGHWGLRGMRERAHAIRATFHLRSRKGVGTEVVLTISAAIAYPRKQRPSLKKKSTPKDDR